MKYSIKIERKQNSAGIYYALYNSYGFSLFFAPNELPELKKVINEIDTEFEPIA